MDFSLTKEQKLFQSTVREFLEKEAPGWLIREWEEQGQYPYDLFQKFAEFGLLGVGLPEEYGGSGGGLTELAIVSEEMAARGQSLVNVFTPTVEFCRQAILGFGNEEQKRHFLPRIVKGECRMAMGLTEPNHGSDLATLETMAYLDGDEYVINGSKIFTTGAHISHYIFLLVRTDKTASPPHRGLSVLLTPTDSSGLTIRTLRKLGGDAVHTCEVSFDNVRVPRSNLLHEEGKGWHIVMAHLDEERILQGAKCTGTTRAAFEYALKYAKEREQFGQPIGKFQAIAHMLADMASDVEICRLLTHYAIWRKENGLPCSKEAAMAKLVTSEAAMRTSHKAVQILGGYGYTMEYEAQRYFRESKFWEIGGGTSQIQRDIIAKRLGL